MSDLSSVRDRLLGTRHGRSFRLPSTPTSAPAPAAFRVFGNYESGRTRLGRVVGNLGPETSQGV